MPAAERWVGGSVAGWVIGLVLTTLPCGLLCALPAGRATSLDEGYGDAFVHYRPYIGAPAPRPESAASAPAQASVAAPTAAAASGPARVDVAWLRQAYPLLQQRAIDDPSEDNIAAEQYVQRIIVDKSQRYAEARMRVVRTDPVLNENNRVPTASLGARAVANADRDAQQQAVRELGRFGGLLVFVDASCRLCAMQLPIVQMLERDYGMQALVVSIDGSTPKGYPGRVLADTGMFRRLGLQLTPSIVYVPQPRAIGRGTGGAVTGEVSGPPQEGDPNRYLVVAQGFYAESDLVKQIAFAGHETRLLSSTVSAGLAVWDRGVASSEALAALRLDVNDPRAIRRTLQPMLLKGY